MPGLVDGHVHPVFGEWTPTQDTIGWIGNYLHGGTTTMISACELHVPGLDYENLTPELVTSLAVVTAATTGRVRWSGVKVYAGTVILVPGMTEAAFRPARRGEVDPGEVHLLSARPAAATRRCSYQRWCRARGIRTKVHTGGVSRSGVSQICGYDMLSWLQPDIAAHVSGGPIPMSDADIDAVVDNTSFALEICSSGNYGSTLRLVRRLADKGQLRPADARHRHARRHRRHSARHAAQHPVPRLGLRSARRPRRSRSRPATPRRRTGSTSACSRRAGRPIIVICGPVEGSTGTSVADAIAHGDLPGISYVHRRRRDRGQRPQPADAAAEPAAVLLLLRRARGRNDLRLTFRGMGISALGSQDRLQTRCARP